jgi:hypothetical protein
MTRLPGSLHRVLVASALVGSGWSVRAGGAPGLPDPAALAAAVGERVAAYYQRAQRLVCLERSIVIPIDAHWSIQGMARTVESDLRVETDAADGEALPEARVTREVRRINGREPRARDRTDRSGCTDPTPVSPEPLAFLLRTQRDEYRFTAVRDGRERNRAALILDFASAQRRSRVELIEDEYGHDDCFDWKGPLAIAGRLWVDAVTYDVLRLDRHVAGPTDVSVPRPLQRKYLFGPWVTIERDDLTLRYMEVAFTDPDEIMLLPESMESTTVMRGDLQSVRRTQAFSGYRRFLTRGRVIKGR